MLRFVYSAIQVLESIMALLQDKNITLFESDTVNSTAGLLTIVKQCIV